MRTTTPVTPAPDRVYDHVKSAILDGTYPGGDLLTEGDLADSVGCSRTPVREGLLRLQSEGFVKLYPKKGALVVPVTAEEAADVWEARALVEGWAAPRAFAHGAEIADDLDALTGRMREAYDADDVTAFSEAELRLGNQQATVSGRPTVAGDRAGVPVTLSSTAKPFGHIAHRTEHSAVVALRRGASWCLR